MTGTPDNPSSVENKIRARRRSLQLPQGELAARCGISRQFLSLLEAGRTQPNVRLALRLAAALECSVEDLFGDAGRTAEPAGLPLALAQPDLPAGRRLTLARLGGRWIGHAADSALSLGGGFTPADGTLAWHDREPRAIAQRPIAELENNLVIAGCDPALALLRGRGDALVPGRTAWVNCGSERALELLAGGWVHLAGLHYGGPTAEENLRQISRRDPRGHWTVIRFTCWENGWMLRAAARGRFGGVESLGEGKLRLANRERGAGSRIWLDRELKRAHVPATRVSGYEREWPNHWECARALADERADVAVGPRAVAATFGLEFVTAEAVAFDLVVPRALLDHPRVQGLLNRLRSRNFQRELETLPGYSAGEAGRTVAR